MNVRKMLPTTSMAKLVSVIQFRGDYGQCGLLSRFQRRAISGLAAVMGFSCATKSLRLKACTWPSQNRMLARWLCRSSGHWLSAYLKGICFLRVASLAGSGTGREGG